MHVHHHQPESETNSRYSDEGVDYGRYQTRSITAQEKLLEEMPLSERKSRRQMSQTSRTNRSRSQPSSSKSQKSSEQILDDYEQFGQEIQQVSETIEASYQRVEDRLDEMENDFNND